MRPCIECAWGFRVIDHYEVKIEIGAADGCVYFLPQEVADLLRVGRFDEAVSIARDHPERCGMIEGIGDE